MINGICGSLNSDLTASWTEAIATVLAALIATAALIAGIVAYRKQAEQLDLQRKQVADQSAINAKQTKVLQLQSDELVESLNERREAQARLVYLTTRQANTAETEHRTDGQTGVVTIIVERTIAELHNASGQPIYDAAVMMSDGPGYTAATAAGVVITGTHIDLKFATMGSHSRELRAYFRDNTGAYWQVDATGVRVQMPRGKRPEYVDDVFSPAMVGSPARWPEPFDESTAMPRQGAPSD